MLRSLSRTGEELAATGARSQNSCMSKEQLIAELGKLTPEERQEVFEVFWPPELRGPTDEEKALLDREIEEYEKDRDRAKTWEEVKAELQRDRERAR